MVRRRRYWVGVRLKVAIFLPKGKSLVAYEGADGIDYGSWFECHFE